MVNQAYDLQERLIDFSIKIIESAEKLPRDNFGIYMSNQMIRSGIAPALNYGEAQVAESRSDFVHKMKICLKELNETFISLSIIKKKIKTNLTTDPNELITECKELMRIFAKSISTAKTNNQLAKSKDKKL